MSITTTPSNTTEKLVELNRRFFNWLVEPIAVRLEPHTDLWLVRNTPNALSVLRCILAIFVDFQIYHATSEIAKWGWIAAVVILIASDGFDGALARRLDIVSRFGQMADPFADKVLIGGLVWGLALKFDAFVFTGLAFALLAIELGNFLAGPIGNHLAAKRGSPEKGGSSKWGKMKFGSESLLVLIGWALLLSRGVVLPLCLLLVGLSVVLALKSFYGYANLIRRALTEAA